MLTKASLVIYKLTSNEEDTFPYLFNNISELKDENIKYNPGMLYFIKTLEIPVL